MNGHIIEKVHYPLEHSFIHNYVDFHYHHLSHNMGNVNLDILVTKPPQQILTSIENRFHDEPQVHFFIKIVPLKILLVSIITVKMMRKMMMKMKMAREMIMKMAREMTMKTTNDDIATLPMMYGNCTLYSFT